ncbi:MAG: zinc-ribbon domain-containing protein [Candidatus Heimdallarchaeaceae archaeon]
MFNKSAVDNLRNSGFLLVIALAINFGLSFVQIPWFIDLIGLILFTIAIIMMVTSVERIANISPTALKDAKKSKKLLIVWVSLPYARVVIASFIFQCFVLIVLLILIIDLIRGIVRIGGFLKLNSTFKQTSFNASLDSWLFKLYAFYGVFFFIGEFLFVTLDLFQQDYSTIFILGSILTVIQMLTEIGMAYILIQNAKKLEMFSQSPEFSVQSVQSCSSTSNQSYKPYESTYTPTSQEQTTVQAEIRYCQNCGAKTLESNNFCTNCGVKLE